MSCKYTYKSNIYTEAEIKDLILEQEVLKNNPLITFTKKIFKTLPYQYKEDLLNEGSKKYGIARGKSSATIKYSQADQNKVDFGLKSIEILQSDKAKQVFEKGNKNNWDLNKILTELQVPKEQKQLILDLGKTDREEIITDLLSQFSYTIEINTAKEKTEIINVNSEVDELIAQGYTYQEALDELAGTTSSGVFESKNTQHYSNLTVPGGTNYTENEISTPLITPSIKGHAAFSTDSGIGWFRSDEKQNYTEQDVDSLIDNMIKSGILQKNCS